MRKVVLAAVDARNIRKRYMKVRKLRQEEHIKTRRLWEKIFTEDTSEFLDYYYSVKVNDNELQCIVTNTIEHPRRVEFGRAQYPALWDYADGVDVMKFLTA